ncbi:MAG: exodeoxyribonuclease III [Planctomycetes bacterium]|jgi:exodeoxyribonuclease-3|nr:exodeoxyribonuclease III [Planctomycetota bacterium]
MKIISWNVNGLRAILKKDFATFLKTEKADILCLQETKIKTSDFNKILEDGVVQKVFSGYQLFLNSAERPGYSGTMILVKEGVGLLGKITDIKIKNNKGNNVLIKKDLSEQNKNNNLVQNGFGPKEFDCEGRVQILELEKFFLLNVYFPNANHELSRLDYKNKFNEALLLYLKKLEKKKPVVITGDFNVAHQEIDLARPKDNIGNPGFTFEERAWFTKFLAKGFIDTFRLKHSNKIQYSWWSYRAGARSRNIGWRIDYFCVSDRIKGFVKEAFILDKVLGSDHAPVGIKIY